MNEFLEFCGIQWWWILLVIIAPIIFLILANAFDIRGHETIACVCFLVTISIFLLGYNYPFKGINTTVERLKAVNLVFKYWKEIGKNKSRTKDPYKCREFMQYLDSINFRKADYLIIGKP